ncbi:nicotinate-nucleotide adenylyltransferase [Streptomyces sp. NPDC058685]|uniref:nicotinate-nucleotide adenylyltransferase n=1 Tax=Streptomyces sp. NPDC058685 TaxID=3346598 RepID=UPI003647751C
MSEETDAGAHVDLGVAHGRFQIFHTDHLRYVMAAKQRCRHLLVGITSPDPSRAPLEESAPHRKDPSANPLTFYERMSMISACLYAEGLSARSFDVIPFPIESPEELPNYAPMRAVQFLTVYDAWGEEKSTRLGNAGYVVEVLWRSSHKAVSGTQIRAAMASGERWEHLVPDATREFLVAHNVPARLVRSWNSAER